MHPRWNKRPAWSAEERSNHDQGKIRDHEEGEEPEGPLAIGRRRLGFLSKYGIASSASTISAGATTPPSNAEWLTSSCSPRKYHGALAGLGVFAGLASSSSGALKKSEMVMMVVTVAISTTASRTKAYGYEKTESSSSSGEMVSKIGLPVTTSMSP